MRPRVKKIDVRVISTSNCDLNTYGTALVDYLHGTAGSVRWWVPTTETASWSVRRSLRMASNPAIYRHGRR